MANFVMHAGTSLSGKTWALQRKAEAWARAGHRILVLDRLREWARADGYCALTEPVGVATTEQGLLRALEESAIRIVSFQPPDIIELTSRDVLEPSRELLREACVLARVAIMTDCVMVTPEVHRIAPNGPDLPALLDDLAGAGRHRGKSCGWWADSQRFALVSTRLRDQLREIRVFAMHGAAELKRLYEDYGGNIREAIAECGRRMAAGEPGWHVVIDPLYKTPPYPLARMGWDAGVVFDRTADGAW